jgi:hypothetical protein
MRVDYIAVVFDIQQKYINILKSMRNADMSARKPGAIGLGDYDLSPDSAGPFVKTIS